MTHGDVGRPDRSEYADYYHLYVGKVPEEKILQTFATQRVEFAALLGSIPEERGGYRYAEGKWSVKEVVGHLIDTERVMGYRALAFARGDSTALPDFDQDLYVAGASFDERPLADLALEFDGLRGSHLALFSSFGDEAWLRKGTASGCSFTTRAVAWIVAGHLIHHVAVLEDRYVESA